jgi:hypothetical protein
VRRRARQQGAGNGKEKIKKSVPASRIYRTLFKPMIIIIYE